MVDRRDEVVVDDGRRAAVVDRGAGHGTTVIAWIALIAALLALTLAWMAYNRTGADLEDRIQEAVNQSAQSIEEATDDTTQNIDEGPDGVDEDDTETNNTEPVDPNQPVQNQ